MVHCGRSVTNFHLPTWASKCGSAEIRSECKNWGSDTCFKLLLPTNIDGSELAMRKRMNKSLGGTVLGFFLACH